MFVCVCVCVCVCECETPSSHLGLPVYATPVATVLVETGDRRRKEEPPPLPPLVPLPQLPPIIDGESMGPRRDETRQDIRTHACDKTTKEKTESLISTLVRDSNDIVKFIIND